MFQRPLVPLAFFAAALIAIIAVAAGLRSAPSARALPPAGLDALGATGQVTALSRLGQETVQVQGSVTIQRQDPHDEGGIDVANAEIVGLNLTGDSLTGPITVTESPALASTGEIRSNQAGQQFPASSFFDSYFDVTIPASGFRTPGSLAVHNVLALRLTAAGPISAWPPTGVKYASPPVQNFDNDGDTLIDEDTADDDADGLYDEDPPGNFNEDTDDETDEDGPIGVDADGDTLVDEDPNCLPLFPTLPAGVCIVSVSITLGAAQTPGPTSTPCGQVCAATPTGTRQSSPTPTHTPTEPPPPGPEDPTFSVAPGGPSGLHPADLLGLSEGTLPVSGNDTFANAVVINSLPFTATQETIGATVEPGEPRNPNDCVTFSGSKGSTVWYRYTPSTSGDITVDTVGSDYDTVLAVYTGGAVNSLTPIACDDDTNGLQSEVLLTAIAGTTYRIQAGGYESNAGSLVLNVHAGSGAGAGAGGPPFVRIPCAELGLTTDGCDSGADGDQDDVAGLSFGHDFEAGNDDFFFSVAPGSQGLAGTGVAAQAACSPAQPQADEFGSSRNGDNAVVFDGDGTGPACPAGATMHLIERPASDDLDALDAHPPSFVDHDGDGTPDDPVFFTLAPGSPSLAAQGRSAADILWTVSGFQPGVYASRATLGLRAGDAIDGLCINDTGAGGAPSFGGADLVYFSLAAGSPSLADVGASAADLLSPGPETAVRRAELGLRQGDDLDAVKCSGTAGGPVTIQVGDVWFCGPTFSNGNPCETKINQGDTVIWDFSGAAMPHTTTHCGADCDDPTTKPLWDSGVISTTSANRTFEFTFNVPGEYPYYCEIHQGVQRGVIIVNAGGQLGDVNCGGTVDAIDALLILQLNAGLLDELDCQQNADVNGSGEIDAVDAAIVLQYVAGLVDTLPP